MKIAILGKGTSSIITALTCIKRGHEVEIYYDPNKPHLNVGESTTPHIASLIKSTLGISLGHLINENIVSLKNGIFFDGWGIGNPFRHYFHSNFTAFHFESGIFNQFIHDILQEYGVKYYQQNIKKYAIDTHREKIIINDIEYDHFICCSGWSENDKYENPIFETVNSAFLYSKECDNNQPYTHHLATQHGWQFGLPFPDRNVIKHGYLFNSKLTNIEDAKNNIKEENVKFISWEPRHCKKMIQNRFCSYNGNRLMFFEPLQALSLLYYDLFANYICSFVEEKSHDNYIKYNETYSSEIFYYQASLAWHYSYGSKYHSAYWNDIKKRSNNLLNLIKFESKYYEESLYHDKKYSLQKHFKIGVFNYDDYFQVHEGMTGEKLEFKDTYTNLL